jgi:Rrf2 family protein
MKLQMNSRLAIYAVLEFAARPDQLVTAAEVAAKYDESPHHLAKVLSELVRAGIVESVRGVGGGYRFIGRVRRLTLLDVIRLFETPGNDAPSGRAGATAEELALGEVLAEIDQHAIATFASITIATMLGMSRQRRSKSGADAAPAKTTTARR